MRPYHYAFQESVDTLYKFRPFRTKTDDRRLREIVEDSTIYFARRSQLNDPFDMAVRHEVRGDKNNPATRARIVADGERLLRQRRPRLPENLIREKLQELQVIPFDELERGATEDSRLMLDRDYPVFCLSAENRRPAQWAYYAGQSTGVCIHFDSRLSRHSPFALARRVQYREERLPLPIPLRISQHEVARRVGLIKHRDWQHEREYRLLSYPGIDLDLEFHGQRAVFAPYLIVGITVGHLMPKKRVRAVCNIAFRHKPPIPAYRANPKADEFRFSIDPIY